MTSTRQPLLRRPRLLRWAAGWCLLLGVVCAVFAISTGAWYMLLSAAAFVGPAYTFVLLGRQARASADPHSPATADPHSPATADE